MEQEMNINNKIFLYAFTGALLVTAAIFMVINEVIILHTLQTSYIIVASVLAGISIPLFYSAVRYDRFRLKRV